MNCPLCNSADVQVLENIKKDDLIALYKKMFSIDCGYLIKEDISLCQCGNCGLRFYDPMFIGDERFYNALQTYDWYYVDEKNEYAEAAKYISETDIVLDVGSGKGAFAKNITAQKYIGLDLSTKAKQMGQDIGVQVENMTIDEYAAAHPASVDVVVSFQVLEHVADPRKFLQSKIDALKPGGKLIIAVPSEDSFLQHVTNGILNMPPHHVTRWTDDALRFIAQQYDLTLIDLYHEPMQDVHKQWYIHNLLQYVMKAPQTVDVSFTRRIVSVCTYALSRLCKRNMHEYMLPHGHTVISLYQKK